jgi:hypothetical protein
VLPAALIVALQGLVHFVKFGNPFLTGYHQWREAPNPHTVWQVLYEFTFDPQWSLFFTFPVLILALFGWGSYLRRHCAEALFLVSLLCGMFVIVEPLPFWRGESAYGPRYFLYLLPALSLPALYVLDWIRGAWITPLLLVALFVAAAQFQVQRLGFFVWSVALRDAAGDCPEAQSYFSHMPVPIICWDHLRCRDRLEDLPYYRGLSQNKTHEQLEAWRREVLPRITYSNLFWFPNINK